MRLLPALAFPLLLAAPLFAQDEDLPPDEIADLVDLYVERGEESLRIGSYEEAQLRFDKALARDPKNRGAHLGKVQAQMAIGEYDKAREQLAQLLALHPGDRAARVQVARMDLLRGKTATAREALREVVKTGGEGPDLVGMQARILLAEALAEVGKRDDARDVLDFFLDHYEKRSELLADRAFHAERFRRRPAEGRPISREMTLIARAMRLYVELSPLDYKFAHNAIELLGYAQEIDPGNWDAVIEYVRTFRVEKERAIAKARTALREAQQRNPELADLYVEVAKSIRIGFSEAEARRLAETALRINPNHVEARAIIARVMLSDNEYGKADDQIKSGLAFNPRHKELLTLAATLKLLLGDQEGFEEGMKEVLAIDPHYGDGFHTAGLIVASRQRRYDRAVKLVRRALALDPMLSDAHASLGIFLANEGRADEAIEALKKSRKVFPFSHPIRDNFKTVLDYVTGTMVEQKTEHFVIRYDPSEFSVASLFLPPLLEKCWDDMTKRYGFTPKVPILVEVFRKADDFSVRTLGIPGIPALGACFGGLITLDSPQALSKNQFSWAGTARHEFAHVISLQLSGGQVPRWFTEGLSVMEEQPLDPGWGLNASFERQVFDGYHTDTLPKIGSFDAMFRSSRVAFAYHVGGLMLQFLKERSGEEGIVKALRLYGRDEPMRKVFRDAFALELDDFDREFRAYIGARVANYHIVPNYRRVAPKLAKAATKNPDDGEILLKVAWAYYQSGRNVDAAAHLGRAKGHLSAEHKSVMLLEARLAQRAGRAEKTKELLRKFFAAGGEDYSGRMILAADALQSEKMEEYVDFLKKAKAAWPLEVTGNNPYALLRRRYLEEGNMDAARAELADQTRISSTNVDIRLTLAREYAQADLPDDAIKMLDEALNLNTFDIRTHKFMAEVARKKKLWPRAIRSGTCYVLLLSDDEDDDVRAMGWLTLAEIYLEAGKTDDAQQAVAKAEKLADEIGPRIEEFKKKLGQE